MVTNMKNFVLGLTVPSIVPLAVFIILLATSIAGAGNIGFMVDADAILDMPFDQFWVDRLETQGHSVEVVGDMELPEDFPDVEIFTSRSRYPNTSRARSSTCNWRRRATTRAATARAGAAAQACRAGHCLWTGAARRSRPAYTRDPAR